MDCRIKTTTQQIHQTCGLRQLTPDSHLQALCAPWAFCQQQEHRYYIWCCECSHWWCRRRRDTLYLDEGYQCQCVQGNFYLILTIFTVADVITLKPLSWLCPQCQLWSVILITFRLSASQQGPDMCHLWHPDWRWGSGSEVSGILEQCLGSWFHLE